VTDLSDATLEAFVDGELASAEAAAIETRAKQDPALAARIDRARALRRRVTGAYDPILGEAPPSRLLSLIQGSAAIVDLQAARERRRQSAWRLARWGAIAAGLALAFIAGRFARQPGSHGDLALGAHGLIARGALADALETQLASNPPSGSAVNIGVSFRAQDGDYCRTFRLTRATTLAGLACRAPSGWDVRLATAAAAPSGTVYQTAADQTPAPILGMVDQMIAGQPLDAAGERRARDAHWRGANGG
jgi:hypothetical protein